MIPFIELEVDRDGVNLLQSNLYAQKCCSMNNSVCGDLMLSGVPL